MNVHESLGAQYLGNGNCQFLVWAPLADRVEVHLVAPREQLVPMERIDRGYHHCVANDVEPGALYMYRLDGGKERPDPASRFQPGGVHGPSRVVDSSEFACDDAAWRGLPLRDYIIYELHVGTFTPEGTFDAAIDRLAELRQLGVTAIEIMPVAQFPGSRNWGYDGVYPFAVQDSYGGPDGLRRLVNACHAHGLAVVLDVVYNHLGPEGNYLADFAPYFTGRYRTPWGQALNFDGPHSDEVRRFFIENALRWLTEFNIDALRLDAIHAITDFSARPFLEELAAVVHDRADRLGRRLYLIAESDLNDARVIRPVSLGGYGIDAQWSDDFHHSLHTLMTGEQAGYYEDFGTVGNLARAFRGAFVYSGQYSTYRKRRHGNSTHLNDAQQFVVCAQNHDQVGNRMLGDRLSHLVSFEDLKLAAGALLLSPYIPLLFMGEEYGETAPFQYFTSHSDPSLVEAVRNGRREEFAEFRWQGEVPDPQDEQTFLRSKLRRDGSHQGKHQVLWHFYHELIRLRRELPPVTKLSSEDLGCTYCEHARALVVRRGVDAPRALMAFNFGEVGASVTVPPGVWRKRLDSAERKWAGDGNLAPELLNSNGKAVLIISPKTLVLFAG